MEIASGVILAQAAMFACGIVGNAAAGIEPGFLFARTVGGKFPGMPMNRPAFRACHRLAISTKQSLFENIAAIIELHRRSPICPAAKANVVRITVRVVADGSLRGCI